MYRYILCSCMNMIRTLACSPAEYEVYINAVNSCVVYISFSFSLSHFIFNNSNSIQVPLIAFRLLYSKVAIIQPSGSSAHLYSLQALLLSPSGVSYCYQAFRLLYYKDIQLSSCSNTVQNRGLSYKKSSPFQKQDDSVRVEKSFCMIELSFV